MIQWIRRKIQIRRYAHIEATREQVNRENARDLNYYGVPKVIEEHTRKWFDQFSRIPMSIMEKVVGEQMWEDVCIPLYHVTCKKVRDNGYSCDFYDSDNNTDLTDDCDDNHDGIAECESGRELMNEDTKPMWGTLFQPQYMDRDWFRNNAQKIYDETGVLVFENEDYDIIIGINSAGHDFYEAYWTKLYIMRGFEWHLK